MSSHQVKKFSFSAIWLFLFMLGPVFSAAQTIPTGQNIEKKPLRPPQINVITQVTFTPASPAVMMKESPVSIQVSYRIDHADGARLQALPIAQGHGQPHVQPGSALLPKGIGQTAHSVYPTNLPVQIDGIELRLVTPDFATVLFSKVYPCRYNYELFKVSDVAVTPSVPNHIGNCPFTFTFTGRITVNANGLVKYRWLRSDGAVSPAETIVSRMAGVHTVQKTWTLGSPGSSYSSLWMAIEILEPNPITSPRCVVSLTCK
jgi:hypothetical protein